MLREREATATELATAIAEKLEDVAGSLRESRELMNAKEAADFLRMPYPEFRRLAPYLPRHRVAERRYVYHRN